MSCCLDVTLRFLFRSGVVFEVCVSVSSCIVSVISPLPTAAARNDPCCRWGRFSCWWTISCPTWSSSLRKSFIHVCLHCKHSHSFAGLSTGGTFILCNPSFVKCFSREVWHCSPVISCSDCSSHYLDSFNGWAVVSFPLEGSSGSSAQCK